MRRSREQDVIAAVNFGESIFCSTCEMKSVGSPQKDVQWQLFKYFARAPDHDVVQRKPMPYSGVFILFELPPNLARVFS
jgi:hypothetical protein